MDILSYASLSVSEFKLLYEKERDIYNRTSNGDVEKAVFEQIMQVCEKINSNVKALHLSELINSLSFQNSVQEKKKQFYEGNEENGFEVLHFIVKQQNEEFNRTESIMVIFLKTFDNDFRSTMQSFIEYLQFKNKTEEMNVCKTILNNCDNYTSAFDIISKTTKILNNLMGHALISTIGAMPHQ